MQKKSSVRTLRSTSLIIAFILMPLISKSKTKVFRKVQEVSFGEMSVKGTIRNPDGAFLVQRKNIKFLPLYELQKSVDEKIRETSYYLKGKE